MKGDLISREALKKSIKSYADDQYAENEYLGEYAIMNIIDNAPAIPQGEWIVLVDEDNIQTCKCSICGRMADIANREFDKFPYCHCGAKMKGGVE